MEICTPVILFMGFSALSLISFVSRGPPIIVYLIVVTCVLVLSALMQFLCLRGLSIISWMLMTFATGGIILMIIIFILTRFMMATK